MTYASFLLQEPDGGLVVLSGGGTSGRMAFLMSVSTLVPSFLPPPLLEVTLRSIKIIITKLPGGPSLDLDSKPGSLSLPKAR